MLKLTNAVHYREKAKQLRLKAVGVKSPGAVREIEAIAALYERLADKIEAAHLNQPKERQ